MSRLATLASEIRALQAALVEHERDACNLGDEHIIERATYTRARLDTALRCYFIESETARPAGCSVHGDAILVTCPECAEQNPSIREHHAAYLRARTEDEADELVWDMTRTAAAIAEGRANDVEPRTTLRILEASRRAG